MSTQAEKGSALFNRYIPHEDRPLGPAGPKGLAAGLAIHVQMTTPETPGSAHGPEESQAVPALFHNYLRATYPFDTSSTLMIGDDSTLSTATIKPGDLILVHSVHANGWADGTVLTTGERGWLPTNYCEAYDHSYLRNLLNAMTQFWDLLGASENANLSTFVRQDYIRGLIAGVRYLLEHADCLHRDAVLVQRHTGIRRMRKGLLADLSSLVQIAKDLQETISEPFAGEVVHYLLEDLMSKAFKVVTRAVGFVDMWSKETNESKPQLTGPQASREPITPALDVTRMKIDVGASAGCTEKHPVDSAKYLPEQDREFTSEEAMDGAKIADQNSGRKQRPLSSVLHSKRGSVAHRLSLVEADRAPPSILASDQLAKVHDRCISYIGAFIGHHLHSRPSSELIDTTERLVKACRNMLSIVSEVSARDVKRSSSVQQIRTNFQAKLEEIIKATQDVFRFSDTEDDDDVVMLPQQSSHLVGVGTGLIRTAGECVVRTRALIEQIGDFELAEPPAPVAERRHDSGEGTAKQGLNSNGSLQSERHSLLEKRLSKKTLPPPPPLDSAALVTTDSFDFGLQAPTTESGTTSPTIPFPLAPSGLDTRRNSAPRASQSNISGTVLKAGPSFRLQSASPARKDSVGISIAGSTDTFRSSARDSGISHVSEASTRATTPEHAKDSKSSDPALLNSFTSLSSMHSQVTEEPNEAETQLLQKTYANELTLNKDGQVTGGSLPALIEQLTMHDCAPDPHFVSAFFVTFRMFTTPRDLAQGLIARFDYVGDSKAVGTPVRLRIYNVFKGWLETYWNPEADRDALGEVRYFALHKLKPHLPSAGDRLAELTRKVTAGYHTGTLNGPLVSGVGKTSLAIGSQTGANKIAPEPIVTKSQLNILRSAAAGGPQCSILDFDPTELARQLTLMTAKIFCDIHAEELLSLAWGKRGTTKARHVRAMCSINTDLAHLVGDTILAPEDVKKRALVIKQWTKVAIGCLEMNNYDSVMGIMCTINSSVVSRLKRTWELVSKKTKTRLEQLNAVIDFSHNHKSLRRKLETPVAPCIPFLGIYLTDLTFLDAGNPKMRELPGAASENGEVVSVINFDKHKRMAEVVSHLQKFQVPYKLRPVPEMQAWIDSHLQRMRAGNEEIVSQFHRRSLLVEPRQHHDDVKPAVTLRSVASKISNHSDGGPPVDERGPKTAVAGVKGAVGDAF